MPDRRVERASCVGCAGVGDRASQRLRAPPRRNLSASPSGSFGEDRPRPRPRPRACLRRARPPRPASSSISSTRRSADAESRLGDAEQRRLEFRRLLRLVDLDMLLHAADQRILQMVERDRLVGDLAQRDDRVLVVVAVERQRRAGGDLARPLRGEQHQLEPVRHLDHTIFDGNTRHSQLLQPAIWNRSNIWARPAPRQHRAARGNHAHDARHRTMADGSLTLPRPRAYISPPPACRPDGRVAMQRTANPCTAVRFRFRPPSICPSAVNYLRARLHVDGMLCRVALRSL